MQIIDTHLHLIYEPPFSLPWLKKYPAIHKSWTATEYFSKAKALGITSALHMEADVAESDMLAEAEFMAKVDPRVIGTIAAARPESPNFASHLAALQAIPEVKGIRRILHEMPDDYALPSRFIENVRTLANAGMTFDLCVRASQLDLAYSIAAAAPKVQFVLDHCGNPDIANSGYSPWAIGIKKLASLPNVAAKVSGIAVNSNPDWTTETHRPYVEHLISSFGWDRVVWGSDHPVLLLNGSLERWVETSQEITSHASEDQRNSLFNANARRIYLKPRLQ